ncbi:MAG: ABC transporter ATP-binding protein, partial [Gammaproteobacteria bacterium]|nr:ABC transporter ATP-binding protein [Gammaproteobacteria bacterium]
ANLREEMRFEIRRLHDEFRITTVYVTHDQGEAMVTSDRIAVMNAGKIEQIDAPYTLYNRPRSRFVAGFIGRTNFLEADRAGDSIGFDGFSMNARQFNGALDGASGSGKLLFSLRPQSMKLEKRQSDTPPATSAGEPLVQSHVVSRAYLGEFWDYMVRPQGSGLELRVSASPHEIFDIGEDVWLKFDPAQMAVLT